MPRDMTKEEQEVFNVIRDKFYTNVNNALGVMGYAGTFEKPYDPTLNMAKGGVYKAIEATFLERPHPVSINYSNVTDKDTLIWLEADRCLDTELARWLVDFSSNLSHRRRDLVDITTFSPPRSARVQVRGPINGEDILLLFGLSADWAPFVPPEADDEEIEVDIDNPLDLDFPDITDIS